MIAGDYFGFYRGFGQNLRKVCPKHLSKLIQINPTNKKRKSGGVSPSLIDEKVQRTLSFFGQNPLRATAVGAFAKRINMQAYFYYSLYAHERFMSFYEMSISDIKPEPDWYNLGVEELKKLQGNNGAWLAEDEISDHIDPRANTCFAILFLIRSTQRSISEFQSGTAIGGYGLPTDTTNMKTSGGSIVDAAPAQSVAGLLELLEKDGESIDENAIHKSMTLSSDPTERAAQIKRLKRMVEGGPWQARRAAARLLGQTSNLDLVPTLIFALTDPDPVVRREARNGLRFISRKFDGFGMPDKPNEKQIEDARRKWKEWYLRANPSYVFLDTP